MKKFPKRGVKMVNINVTKDVMEQAKQNLLLCCKYKKERTFSSISQAEHKNNKKLFGVY